jgi:Sec-independent protein translocase protein TatA
MLGLPRGAEWIVILVIVVLLFGPAELAKLPGTRQRHKSLPGRTGQRQADDEQTTELEWQYRQIKMKALGRAFSVNDWSGCVESSISCLSP